MGTAPEKAAAPKARVDECGVTDCVHNEDRECHAGTIEVRMQDGRAACATYEPEEDRARP